MVCAVLSWVLADVHQEIENLAKEFEKVNGSERITPDFEFDDSMYPRLIRFDEFFQKLKVIVLRNPSAVHRREESSDTTPPTQTVLPAGSVVPTTPPPRSENLINPQFSSTSNATMSSAAESTDEHFTQSLANVFVFASFKSLIKSLNSIAWYRDTRYKLQHGYQTIEFDVLISGIIKRCM